MYTETFCRLLHRYRSQVHAYILIRELKSQIIFTAVGSNENEKITILIAQNNHLSIHTKPYTYYI